MRWHQLSGTGDDFLDAAPFRYVTTIDVPAPPDETWTALTADDTLVSWSPLVSGLRWTTSRPFGVGTTREVTLLKLITARERYYRWEPGRRRRSPQSRSPCRGWTLALEPQPALKPLLHSLNLVTAWLLRGVARGLGPQVR